MKSALLALLAGLVFGMGLLISGMTQPTKVIGFLDVTRHWDPSLGFVMAGAVGVYALAARAIGRLPRPWLARDFDLPRESAIDVRLAGGAAIFGVGWGLSGFCPGPAIVSAAAIAPTALVFIAAMLVGMVIGNAIDRR